MNELTIVLAGLYLCIGFVAGALSAMITGVDVFHDATTWREIRLWALRSIAGIVLWPALIVVSIDKMLAENRQREHERLR